MRKRNSWYERFEVKRINKDWVENNVRLTDREIELLEIINYRKLVRRDMLEVISPSYRHLGDNRTRIINRSLNKMFKNMVIDKVHEPQQFMKGNKPATVALDRAGCIYIGKPFKQRIRRDLSVINGVEYIHRYLPSNYRHINGINQLEVETILFCEDTGNELTEWVLEKPIELFYGQEEVVLIPDILMGIKPLYEPLNAFYAYIEFDTGSENIRYKEPPIIRDKIIKYKKYMLSRLWEDEFEKFPIVIFVTEDDKRIGFFNKKCEENGLIGVGVYYKNYKNFMYSLSNFFSR